MAKDDKVTTTDTDTDTTAMDTDVDTEATATDTDTDSDTSDTTTDTDASTTAPDASTEAEVKAEAPTENGAKLFVGNISWSTTEDSLKSEFSAVGTVVEAKIITDRETQRSRGFAFVTMSTPEEANKAVEELNGKEIDGRNIKVAIATERPRREFGAGPRRSFGTGAGPRRSFNRDGGSGNRSFRSYNE